MSSARHTRAGLPSPRPDNYQPRLPDPPSGRVYAQAPSILPKNIDPMTAPTSRSFSLSSEPLMFHITHVPATTSGFEPPPMPRVRNPQKSK